MTRHFVFCWEIGADLGHISQIATVAGALRQRGHRVSVVLKDLCHAQRYFGALDVVWYQAPQPAGFRASETPLNHADILRESGYDNPARLAGLLQAWRNLFALLQPDLVISEAAPTAALAARCSGLHGLCLDNGFFLPPPSTPMPALRAWQPADRAELLRREARTLQVINAALQQLRLPPLQTFAQLFELPTYWLTWPALNHFGPHSAELHLGPIYADSPGLTLAWPAGAGRKVFAYLKPQHPHASAVLEWCLRRGDRLLAYLPFWPAAELRRLQTLGSITISQEPLDLGPVLDDCAWVVCHGGVGTVSRALRAGKPLLLLPSHVEQIRTAQALSALQLAVLVQEAPSVPGLRIDAEQLEQARPRAEPGLARAEPGTAGGGTRGRTHTKETRLMRILFIHQNFPGQFRHVAAHLAQQPGVEVLAIGRDSAPGLPGVRLLRYTPHRGASPQTHPYARPFEDSVLHGQQVLRLLLDLKAKGYRPDVIVAHPGWGETLYAKDAFPQAKLIHFCEYYYHAQGADANFDPEFPLDINGAARLRSRNALHLLNLENCDLGITPTRWQHSLHPAAYRDKIRVIHEGIDTANLGPDPEATLRLPNGLVLRAGEPIITYVARNLEPYRGFHSFMRALPHVLKEHPTCQVVIVGGDEVSYGSPPKDAANWRTKLLAENPVDLDRVHFLGKVPYATYKQVLQVSAAHVYLTYPFVLSWSLLEAMASGCLIIGSDTAPVREVIRDGENGVLVDFFDVQGIASKITQMLSVTKPISMYDCSVKTADQYSTVNSIAAYHRLIMHVEGGGGLNSIIQSGVEV